MTHHSTTQTSTQEQQALKTASGHEAEHQLREKCKTRGLAAEPRNKLKGNKINSHERYNEMKDKVKVTRKASRNSPLLQSRPLIFGLELGFVVHSTLLTKATMSCTDPDQKLFTLMNESIDNLVNESDDFAGVMIAFIALNPHSQTVVCTRMQPTAVTRSRSLLGTYFPLFSIYS